MLAFSIHTEAEDEPQQMIQGVPSDKLIAMKIYGNACTGYATLQSLAHNFEVRTQDVEACSQDEIVRAGSSTNLMAGLILEKYTKYHPKLPDIDDRRTPTFFCFGGRPLNTIDYQSLIRRLAFL